MNDIFNIPSNAMAIVKDSKLLCASILLTALSMLTAYTIARVSISRLGAKSKNVSLIFVLITFAISVLLTVVFGPSMEFVKGMVLCQILIYASYADICRRELDDGVHIMIILTSLIGVELYVIPAMLISAFIMSVIILFPVVIGGSNIGGADIKLSMACAFMLGLSAGLFGLIVGMLLAIIVNSIIKKGKDRSFALVPYLAVGFMTAYFI